MLLDRYSAFRLWSRNNGPMVCGFLPWCVRRTLDARAAVFGHLVPEIPMDRLSPDLRLGPFSKNAFSMLIPEVRSLLDERSSVVLLGIEVGMIAPHTSFKSPATPELTYWKFSPIYAYCKPRSTYWRQARRCLCSRTAYRVVTRRRYRSR